MNDSRNDPSDSGDKGDTGDRAVPSDFMAAPFLGEDFHVAQAMNDAVAGASAMSPAPSRVGSFRVGALIGRGSFASVYSATQDKPVVRRVALKVLDASLDQRSALQRFHREQHALARLEHPGIARLYEAGMTPDSRLYFAMEFVDGEPILAAATRAELPVRERIRLIRDACRAVHYAHMKGLIHRDLKPDNILVTTIDGALATKIIDFGVAKAIASPIDDSSLRTVAGQLVGTPAYMAPEQLEGRVDDVDVRSDVYALGAVLYELVSQRRPHQIGGMAPLDAARLVREERLRPLRDSVQGVSIDLDRALESALSVDPSDRYQSAAEFASDLDRVLDGEPVRSRTPGSWESTWRWSRRHPVQTAVALAALIGLVTTSVSFWSMAQTAKREVAHLQAAVKELLHSAIGLADRVGVVRERRAIIERAAALSATLLELRPNDAESRRIRADALIELSKIMRDATPSELDGARSLREEALAILDGLVAESPSKDDLAKHAIALILCGDIDKEVGDLAGAQRHYELALDEHRLMVARDPSDLASARQVTCGFERLGDLAGIEDRGPPAIEYFRRQLDSAESMCMTHPDQVEIRWDRCLARRHLILYALARPNLDEAVRLIDAACVDAAALVASDPDSRPYRNLYAMCLLDRSKVLRLRGDVATSISVLATCCREFELLAAADPSHVDVHVNLLCARMQETHILEARGDLDGAMRLSDEICARFELLRRDRPTNPSIMTLTYSSAVRRAELRTRRYEASALPSPDRGASVKHQAPTPAPRTD